MTVLPLLHAQRRSRTIARAPKPLPRKDFGTLPVCGSVRSVASQRARAMARD